MFLGEFEHSIDDKGRITIPAKFRGRLAAGVVITRAIDRCLLLYPIDVWEVLAQKISALPQTAPNARELRRQMFGGASDLIGGAVCASAEFIGSLMDLHTGPLMVLGPTMDPNVAASVGLRLPHLPLRMQAHSERTLKLAERTSALGVDVCYPGLPSHPDHELLKQLYEEEFGFGGLMTIDAGSEECAIALMNRLQNEQRFGYVAVSLGYFETLMSCSASSTSSEMPADAMEKAAISPGLVRMAVGYTGSLEQRWSQLRQALLDVELASSAKAS